MGDTHHDPTDHSRTTHPRAGITMKDNFFWPGYILFVVAMFGVVAAVLAAAYRHYEWLSATVLISVLAAIAGTLWVIVELRHVADIDAQWEQAQQNQNSHLRQRSA